MPDCRSSLRWASLVAALAVAIPATQSSAQTAQNCLEGQSRYAGTICRGMAKCYVKAKKHQTSLDPDCIPDRTDALEARYNSIENGDNCLTEPAGSTTANMLESGVQNFADALGEGECAAKKVGALGRECKQMMMCYADSAASSSPSVDAACLDEAVDRLLEVFANYESRNICNFPGDGSARSDDVDALTDSIWTYLRGVGTTTTSTTTTSLSTTTTLAPSCPENGAYDPCTAYRDNVLCSSCVDLDPDPDSDTATTLCGQAAVSNCSDADKNTACGFAINSATSCGPTCCP